jgi:hypothetical protein
LRWAGGAPRPLARQLRGHYVDSGAQAWDKTFRASANGPELLELGEEYDRLALNPWQPVLCTGLQQPFLFARRRESLADVVFGILIISATPRHQTLSLFDFFVYFFIFSSFFRPFPIFLALHLHGLLLPVILSHPTPHSDHPIWRYGLDSNGW